MRHGLSYAAAWLGLAILALSAIAPAPAQETAGIKNPADDMKISDPLKPKIGADEALRAEPEIKPAVPGTNPAAPVAAAGTPSAKKEAMAAAAAAAANKSLKKIPSLFYTPEEVTDIHLAINTYIKRQANRDDLTFDEEAFLRRLSGVKKASHSKLYTYTQFFLDSLVYHGPENWIMWINGIKFTQDTPGGFNNLQILHIDSDKVTLEWMPPTMEKVLEIWSQYPNDEVIVDQLRGKVTFTLHPNQTFSSYVMKVLEGKVKPVTVDISLPNGFTKASTSVKDSAAVPDPAEKPAEGGAADTGQEGLPGLINSYEKLGGEKP